MASTPPYGMPCCIDGAVASTCSCKLDLQTWQRERPERLCFADGELRPWGWASTCCVDSVTPSMQAELGILCSILQRSKQGVDEAVVLPTSGEVSYLALAGTET